MAPENMLLPSFRLNAMSQLGGSECFPCSRQKFFLIVPNLCVSMTEQLRQFNQKIVKSKVSPWSRVSAGYPHP